MAALEEDYVAVNRSAYDALAKEYRKRETADRIKDAPLIAPFVSYIQERFGTCARILDIGPGNGVNLSMFREAGLTVVGVDISSQMLSVARDICPDADLYLGDFLAIPFADRSFQGVFAKASLHCLPKTDAVRAFCKIHRILVEDGIFYVTTTADSYSTEGYSSKEDYPGQLVRFRKRWTPRELVDAVTESGFVIRADGYDVELDRDKRWYNIWAIKHTASALESRDDK